MTPFEFTQFAVMHKGTPIDLERRPWLRRIYNTPVSVTKDGRMRRKMLLIFGRQCEKSTTIGNTLISMSNLVPYLRLLYVTASNLQMREFSDERLRAIISDSPILKSLTGEGIKGMRETQNVQTKRWMNQSKIVLRSCYRGADRVRGISSDMLAIDELQDILTDSLPVIEETLFHSELKDGPMSIYAGTPKTLDNPLEYYWSRFSTMNEWMISCEGCNTWQKIEMENIGNFGLVCRKCDKELNPVTGKAQWVCTSSPSREWVGFKLPQPIVPYAYRGNKDEFERHWESLLGKKKRYSRQRFMNEVMATSYDSGIKPISFDELRRACCGVNYNGNYTEKRFGGNAWAGVDWGTGDASYTVLVVFTYSENGAFEMIYAKKYEGTESEPDFAWRDIVKVCKALHVTRIGADWGFGFHTNSCLRRAFGRDRVILYQHAGNQKDKVKWDSSGMKYITHRTRVLQDVFTMLKNGKNRGMILPTWDISETIAQDILCVYSEYSEMRRQIVFNHPKGSPDDFLHAICYSLLVSQIDIKRPEFYLPGS
jgi:hypothetical protein